MDCGDQEKEKQGLVSLGQQVGFSKKIGKDQHVLIRQSSTRLLTPGYVPLLR